MANKCIIKIKTVCGVVEPSNLDEGGSSLALS